MTILEIYNCLKEFLDDKVKALSEEILVRASFLLKLNLNDLIQSQDRSTLIKKQFLSMSRMYHPDKNSESIKSESTKLFQLLNNYSTIMTRTTQLDNQIEGLINQYSSLVGLQNFIKKYGGFGEGCIGFLLNSAYETAKKSDKNLSLEQWISNGVESNLITKETHDFIKQYFLTQLKEYCHNIMKYSEEDISNLFQKHNNDIKLIVNPLFEKSIKDKIQINLFLHSYFSEYYDPKENNGLSFANWIIDYCGSVKNDKLDLDSLLSKLKERNDPSFSQHDSLKCEFAFLLGYSQVEVNNLFKTFITKDGYDIKLIVNSLFEKSIKNKIQINLFLHSDFSEYYDPKENNGLSFANWIIDYCGSVKNNKLDLDPLLSKLKERNDPSFSQHDSLKCEFAFLSGCSQVEVNNLFKDFITKDGYEFLKIIENYIKTCEDPKPPVIEFLIEKCGQKNINLLIDYCNCGKKISFAEWVANDFLGTIFENIDLTGIKLKNKTFTDSNFKGTNLENGELDTVNFENTTLNETNLRNVKFKKTNWNDSTINNTNFSRTPAINVKNNRAIKLIAANFHSCSYKNSNFYNSNFENATFLNDNFINTKFDNCEFRNVKFRNMVFNDDQCGFSNCTFNDSDLIEQNLDNVNFQSAKITLSNLNGVSIKNANFSFASFKETSLENSQLNGSDLTQAILKDCNLSHSNLISANLSDATLKGCNLYGAQLNSANLSGAFCNCTGATVDSSGYSINLENADLSNANIKGFRLDYANLRGANLCGVKDIDLKQFIKCKSIAGIKLDQVSLNGYDKSLFKFDPPNYLFDVILKIKEKIVNDYSVWLEELEKQHDIKGIIKILKDLENDKTNFLRWEVNGSNDKTKEYQSVMEEGKKILISLVKLKIKKNIDNKRSYDDGIPVNNINEILNIQLTRFNFNIFKKPVTVCSILGNDLDQSYTKITKAITLPNTAYTPKLKNLPLPTSSQGSNHNSGGLSTSKILVITGLALFSGIVGFAAGSLLISTGAFAALGIGINTAVIYGVATVLGATLGGIGGALPKQNNVELQETTNKPHDIKNKSGEDGNPVVSHGGFPFFRLNPGENNKSPAPGFKPSAHDANDMNP